MHTITIDANSESVSDIVAKLEALDHFSAFVTSSGTLTLRTEPGYTFDFTGAVPSLLDTTGLSGTSTPEVSGTYRGSTNDTFTVEFLGTGTVGVTAGLIAEVTDSNGAVVAQLDVGAGYGLGQPLLMRDGLSLALSSGNVVAGESFSIPAVADSDTSSFLTSLGLNTFFVGDSASTLQVSEVLRKNSDLLATSRDGNVEDATNINRMTLRRSIATTDGDRLSVEQFTQRFVAELGRQVEQHDEMTTHLSLVGTNLAQQQSAVSGVDPNEELVHMLQFQRSFQTAARYISVISDVTAELMNII
jgi:flagellar hook-associated protein 1 FlgK